MTTVFENDTHIRTRNDQWDHPVNHYILTDPDTRRSGHFTGTTTAGDGTLSQVEMTYIRDRRAGKPAYGYHGSVVEIGTPVEVG